MSRPTTLITGASAGIGREMARVFAANGHDLILVARREAVLEALAEEIRLVRKVDVAVMAQDLTADGAAQALFDRVAAAELTVDVLVNNAGMNMVRPFADTPLAETLRMIQLNIVALTALTRLFLEPMVARNSGRILNIASIGGFVPTPSFAVYGASKAFVLSFTEALGQEMVGKEIAVTAFCPGFTRTEMLELGGGIEKYIPDFMTLDAEAVAEEAYRACMKGRALHIDSWRNEAAVQWLRLQPRWLVRNVGGFMTRLLK